MNGGKAAKSKPRQSAAAWREPMHALKIVAGYQRGEGCAMGLSFADAITGVVAIPAFLVAGLTIYCLVILVKELIGSRR